MKKAVLQHEDYKLASKILRTNGMDAKKGRLLLKKHYVALLEEEGLKDASKLKVATLKSMFWSKEDVVQKYVNADPGENDDSIDDDDNCDAPVSPPESATAAAPLPPASESAPTSAGVSVTDTNDEDSDDEDSDEWRLSEVEFAAEEVQFEVGDEVEAYYYGDETTSAGWQSAVVIETDEMMDQYTVVLDYNGEEVSSITSICDTHLLHTHIHTHTINFIRT